MAPIMDQTHSANEDAECEYEYVDPNEELDLNEWVKSLTLDDENDDGYHDGNNDDNDVDVDEEEGEEFEEVEEFEEISDVEDNDYVADEFRSSAFEPNLLLEEFEVDGDDDDENNAADEAFKSYWLLEDKAIITVFVVDVSLLLHIIQPRKEKENQCNIFVFLNKFSSCPLLLSKPTVRSTLLHTSVSTGHEPLNQRHADKTSFRTAILMYYVTNINDTDIKYLDIKERMLHHTFISIVEASGFTGGRSNTRSITEQRPWGLCLVSGKTVFRSSRDV